jgi:hypothetical protein
MADNAFALSPISARGSLPSESDYEAIRDAFMETARGRWFLGEYASRNRNADTTAVLDAVARLEQTLAKQRVPASDDPSPIKATVLADVMAIFAALRAKVEAAANPGLVENVLAPLRASAQIVQEITWGLRESGSDFRICTLLDGQVAAINLACDQLWAANPSGNEAHLFDEAFARLNELTGHLQAAGAKPAGTDTMSPSQADATPRSDAAKIAPLPEKTEIEAVSLATAKPDVVEFKRVEPEAEFEVIEPKAIEPDAVESGIAARETAELKAAEHDMAETMTAEIKTAGADPSDKIAKAADVIEAEPEAIPVKPRGPTIRFEEPEDVVQQVVVIRPEVVELEFVEPEPQSKFEAAIAKPVSVVPDSLGASAIANGIVSVSATRPDPLAPLKRMSQAEKIAFFS